MDAESGTNLWRITAKWHVDFVGGKLIAKLSYTSVTKVLRPKKAKAIIKYNRDWLTWSSSFQVKCLNLRLIMWSSDKVLRFINGLLLPVSRKRLSRMQVVFTMRTVWLRGRSFWKGACPAASSCPAWSAWPPPTWAECWNLYWPQHIWYLTVYDIYVSFAKGIYVYVLLWVRRPSVAVLMLITMMISRRDVAPCSPRPDSRLWLLSRRYNGHFLCKCPHP